MGAARTAGGGGAKGAEGGAFTCACAGAVSRFSDANSVAVDVDDSGLDKALPLGLEAGAGTRLVILNDGNAVPKGWSARLRSPRAEFASATQLLEGPSAFAAVPSL